MASNMYSQGAQVEHQKFGLGTVMSSSEVPAGEQAGSVVTYFEAKGFGFLRPDDGGRDIFFHVSRLAEGLATDLRPGTRVMYELGMDRTGKMAAASIRIAPATE